MAVLKNILLPVFLIIGLPVAGIMATGMDYLQFLEFPPETRFIQHAPFSLPVFILILAAIFFSAAPFVCKALRFKPLQKRGDFFQFPWWGYISAAGVIFFWAAAWTRFEFFTFFQAHTFFPLWFAFIILVNAVTFKISGRCIMLDSKKKFIMLFFASALFWWIFEYLNRFVQNWYYSGSQYSACKYFILATLSFSTVLPAVESIKELLLTSRLFKKGFQNCTPVPYINSKPLAFILLFTSCITLFFLGVFPDILFFSIWISPFLIILAFQNLYKKKHIFHKVEKGDLTHVAVYASAALVCGFFWELFNYYSLARWHYSIPWVNVLKIFEMPLLGYAGYLPFGLECALIISFVSARN